MTDTQTVALGRPFQRKRGPAGVGERNSRSIFSDGCVVAIRKAYADGTAMDALAALYRCSPSAIRHIIKRRRWRHLP